MIQRGKVLRNAYSHMHAPLSIAREETPKGHTPATFEVAPRAVSRATVTPAAVVRAENQSRVIVQHAEQEAERIRVTARKEAAQLISQVREEARAEEAAKYVAAYIQLRTDEEQRQSRDLQKSLGLAVLLAERLIGESLPVEDTRMGELALQALAAARGARAGVIEASPEDVPVLHRVLPAQILAAFRIEPNAVLGRGSLVLRTDAGTVDARLPVQLARLAEALRAAMPDLGADQPTPVRG
jgi:flagellar biosynthesis/type III secretory pathway protein FliH